MVVTDACWKTIRTLAVRSHKLKKPILGILLLTIGCLATAADSSSYESALAKGTQLLEEKKYTDAAAVLNGAIESLRAEQGGDTLDTVRLLLPAAKAQAGMGEDKRGYAHFETAIELLEESSSKERADLIVQAFEARRSAKFSWAYRKKMSIQLATIYDLATEVLGNEDLRTASMATELGTTTGYYGRRKKAEMYFDQAYTILIGSSFVDPDPIGLELLSLGAAYIRVERMETADELLRMALAIGTSTDRPIPIQRVAATYPSDCLTENVSGEVDTVFRVDDKGHVSDVKVTDIKSWFAGSMRNADNNPCGESLAQAAQEAVSQFRYIPRLENGLLVASEDITSTISFDIE